MKKNGNNQSVILTNISELYLQYKASTITYDTFNFNDVCHWNIGLCLEMNEVYLHFTIEVLINR